jgi:NAD(P)-dependent dehydrogenase (short-subunit alcohol dehydrogenase family)
MDLQLKNRKALVTGSTAGIGFAIASLFAEEGAAVVVSGRSQERVDAAVKKIRQAAKKCRDRRRGGRPRHETRRGTADQQGRHGGYSRQ